MSTTAARRPHKFEALAIASSTGGPQALAEVLKSLRGKLDHIPVFITQHMPASFTSVLAQNLARVSGMDCHEAKDGERVKPGVIYVAPGDYHMLIEFTGMGNVIRLNQDPPVNFCRPSADPMLYTLAAIYKDRLLTVVLTGMGSDALNGCKTVVNTGGTVIAQDEASSVVWGMPRAVSEAKLAKYILPLDQIWHQIARMVE